MAKTLLSLSNFFYYYISMLSVFSLSDYQLLLSCERLQIFLHTLYGGIKAYLEDFNSNKKNQNFVRISIIFCWLEIFIPILAQTPGNKQNKTYIHRTYSLAKVKQQQHALIKHKKLQQH